MKSAENAARWTPENVELLKKFCEAGNTASQCAALLGPEFTRNAIIGKAIRLGITLGGAKYNSGGARAGAGRPKAIVPSPAPGIGKPAKSERRNITVAVPKLAPAPIVAKPASVAIPTSGRVTILDLRESMCKWPIGEDGEGHLFCGAEKASVVTPYCEAHQVLSYVPSTKRRAQSGEANQKRRVSALKRGATAWGRQAERAML